MSGFIGDPNGDRIDRLEAVLDLLLPLVPLSVLSPRVREAIEKTRQGDYGIARLIMQEAEMDDPLPAAGDDDPCAQAND